MNKSSEQNYKSHIRYLANILRRRQTTAPFHLVCRWKRIQQSSREVIHIRHTQHWHRYRWNWWGLLTSCQLEIGSGVDYPTEAPRTRVSTENCYNTITPSTSISQVWLLLRTFLGVVFMIPIDILVYSKRALVGEGTNEVMALIWKEQTIEVVTKSGKAYSKQ